MSIDLPTLDDLERRAASEPGFADALLGVLRERGKRLADERAIVAMQTAAVERGRAQATRGTKPRPASPAPSSPVSSATGTASTDLEPLAERNPEVLEAARERLTPEGFAAFEALFDGATSPRLAMNYINAKAGRTVVERTTVMTTRYQRLRQAGWAYLDAATKKNFPASTAPPTKQEAEKANDS